MKVHYRKMKGYRRHPGPGGRPVYYIQMAPEEVAERRAMWAVIGTLILMLGGVALWILSMT